MSICPPVYVNCIGSLLGGGAPVDTTPLPGPAKGRFKGFRWSLCVLFCSRNFRADSPPSMTCKVILLPRLKALDFVGVTFLGSLLDFGVVTVEDAFRVGS